MAGIGFELKKLYTNKGLLSKLKSYFYSIFVTIGPLIISVVMITSIQMLLKRMGVARNDIDLLQSTIMYSFIGAVVLTSGYCMLLSRYLSDRLYREKTEDMLPALIGSLAVISLVLGIIGIVFYLRSPLDLFYKFIAYLLFIGLSIQMVIAVFVSAIKDFRKVAYSFAASTVLGVLIGYLLISFTSVEPIYAVLIGFDATIILVTVALIFEVKKFFRVKSHRYFDFIEYFDKTALIFFTNSFYILGLYVHNFAFWIFSDYQVVVRETYIYAPYYDIPASYAFLSLTPTLVMFVVKVETAFYEKYRNFFYYINNNAAYDDIRYAKEEMLNVTNKELIYIMEIQLFFSIGFIILGRKLLPYIGFSNSMMDTFSILVLAYYCVIISFVLMTIMLYYDNQKDAVTVAGFLMVTNFVLSSISVRLGETYYGMGFLISGFLTLVLALSLLYTYLSELEYHIFCNQVSWQEKKIGFVGKILRRTLFRRRIEDEQ